MIASTRGGVALTDGYPELENPLQGHDLPPAVVRDPHGMATLGTGPLKWPQGSCELRFGFGGSPGHRFPPLSNKGQLFHLSVHPLSSGVFRSAFFYIGNLCWSIHIFLYLAGSSRRRTNTEPFASFWVTDARSRCLY